jgi:hypothetical protein
MQSRTTTDQTNVTDVANDEARMSNDEGMTKFQHLRCLRYLLLKESRTEGNEGEEERDQPAGYPLSVSSVVETRSLPKSLGATLAPLPSMSLFPVAPFFLFSFEIRVYSCRFVVKPNQFDAELRRTDKGNCGDKR